MHITALDHIVLNVADVERSLAFYTGRLGLEPLRVDEFRRGEAKFPSVRINDATIVDLFPPAMHQPADSGGANLNHFCLVTSGDIDAIRSVLESAGVVIIDRMEHNFGARGYATSIYIRDPDANVVEIRAY